MKVEVTCKEIAMPNGTYRTGDIITGKDRDLKPLVDGGFAREVTAEEAKAPKKKAS